MEISNGKAPSPDGPAMYKHRSASGNLSPKSLNYLVRKHDNHRIEKENHKLAKRLFAHGSNISKKKFDAEWEHHLRLKARLSKANKKLPGVKGSIKLPPIMRKSPSQESLRNESVRNS